MAYALVVVHPFQEHRDGKLVNYVKGQVINDPVDVARHSDDRENHFARIWVADAPAPAAE